MQSSEPSIPGYCIGWLQVANMPLTWATLRALTWWTWPRCSGTTSCWPTWISPPGCCRASNLQLDSLDTSCAPIFYLLKILPVYLDFCGSISCFWIIYPSFSAVGCPGFIGGSSDHRVKAGTISVSCFTLASVAFSETSKRRYSGKPVSTRAKPRLPTAPGPSF